MRGWSKACWLSFGDWLAGGAPGMLPWMLLAALGPVWLLLPRARQGAEALGPWLLALLAARERAGRSCREATVNGQDARWCEQAWQARPFTQAEAQHEASWLQWGLEAELLRLVWLVEAPCAWLKRDGWPESQARYWALVVSLARVGHIYAVLARRLGRERATQMLEEAVEQVWQRAAEDTPLAV